MRDAVKRLQVLLPTSHIMLLNLWIAGVFLGMMISAAIRGRGVMDGVNICFGLFLSAMWFICAKRYVRPLLILAALLIAGTVQAQPTLLAEFTWQQPQPVTLPADYVLRTANIGVEVIWRESVTSYPFTSHAPADILARLHGPMYGEHSDFDLFNGPFRPEFDLHPGSCVTCRLSRLIGPERDQFLDRAIAAGWDVEMFVPSRGTSLTGYGFTDVERTVTAGAQTIRFYGMAVPEPASWLLVIVAVSAFHWRTSRGNL